MRHIFNALLYRLLNTVSKFGNVKTIFDDNGNVYVNTVFLNKERNRLATSIDDEDSFLINNLEADKWFDGDDLKLELQKAINKLPEKQRLVFNMRYFDEMKYEDMSEILDTSVGALKASYHHAVKKIEDFFSSID